MPGPNSPFFAVLPNNNNEFDNSTDAVIIRLDRQIELNNALRWEGTLTEAEAAKQNEPLKIERAALIAKKFVDDVKGLQSKVKEFLTAVPALLQDKHVPAVQKVAVVTAVEAFAASLKKQPQHVAVQSVSVSTTHQATPNSTPPSSPSPPPTP
jgi:hypothetical protein